MSAKRFEGTDRYVATDDLRIAVNASITLDPEKPLQAAIESPFESRRGASGGDMASGAAPWVSPHKAPTVTPKAADRASSEDTDGCRSDDSSRER